MSEHNERNAEIWSTRVQRELLALTTENAPEQDKKDTQGVLPPFMTVKDHQLDIAAGTCVVSFLVEIVGKRKKRPPISPRVTDEETPAAQETTPTEGDNGEADDSKAVVTIKLDASLVKKADGTLDTAAPAYPFLPPRALMAEGASCFPEGSTIQDGDPVAIDCDWTPSLHLSDAVLNIGLKIKESILQQEPFHPLAEVEMDPILEDVMSSARAIGEKVGRSFRGFSFKAPDATQKQKKKKPAKKKETPAAAPGEVRIGDEINLLEPPWVESQGIYSCKAVRRPEFVEAAIQHAALESGEQASSGAASMFRNLTQSAKNVLQESFIMITETHIIEMTSSKLNLSTGKITFAIPIELMAKLKFRRQESISLFFKTAPNDPLIYMCPDSADAVHQIQSVLKRHGVKGKHTNAAAHRAIGEALQLVQEIQTKELALRHDPTVERVNEIMDLYRQAAERFEAAGDVRHEEVVTHMRKFLALPVTTSILDGSYKKEEANPDKPARTSSSDIPEGEVLEASSVLLNASEEDEAGKESKEDDKDFEASMESIMKEAKEDLSSFLDDDVGGTTMPPTPPKSSGSDSADDIVDDAFADLDAMLSEADKELAELMGSS
ncbi:expressed unknown protein [Seminavis robusta]|uniref:Uncharacterized protein n=1 Tax=Seminavis robusta TaxID=568900 RepID=A0A9N8DUU9_9STRA|nr:expressed unknown protein [Seminavis robusta]|eukprot:Sro359_g126060.1 n/a (608) ;mRNA; f:18530-20437